MRSCECNLVSSQLLKLEVTAKHGGKKKKTEGQQYSFSLRSQLFDTQAFSFAVDTCSAMSMTAKVAFFLLPLTLLKNGRTIERERFLSWLESLRELTAIPLPTRIFGASPNMGYTKPNDELPEIIQKSFQYVEANALHVEGIYRLSGSAAKVAEYVEEFNAGKFVNFDLVRFF